LWLKNIQTNEKEFGFRNTIRGITTKHSKSIVLAAGPESKKVFGDNFKSINKERQNLTIVACDGALKMLSQNNCVPDYVVSVDGAPIIANFYKNSKEILQGVTAILATTVHPDVVSHCIDGGAKIKWVQPFFKDSPYKEFFRNGIPSIKMGGNVGTTSYLLTSIVLKGNPIGLMGIEFSWSDETPYHQTQYYDGLMEVLDHKFERVKDQYVHIKNNRDGKMYMADPVYYAYFLMLKEIWEELPMKIKQNTYNLTKGGILNINGLKYATVKKFLDIT
tara:strand:- start:320 stop:1147 length:828 start_codon:yes stop_codon:yes gene_type:complete